LVNRAWAGERDPIKQKVQIARTASGADTLAASIPAVRRIGDLEVVVKGDIS
jgi:hypothetical protein